MEEHIFFNMELEFEVVGTQVFQALGLSYPLEGDSSHCLSGTYYVQTVFGVAVRLEENVYDFEDQFNYMLTIEKDYIKPLKTPEYALKYISRIVATMLIENLGLSVGVEEGKAIRMVSNGEGQS